MIVLDASCVLDLLLGTRRGERVARRLADADRTLYAPELIDLEVAQVLRRFVRADLLTAGRASAALEDLADLDLERVSHQPLLPRVWSLRHNLTAYDASYVALAEALDATLLTGDARLARAPHRARVEVVEA